MSVPQFDGIAKTASASAKTLPATLLGVIAVVAGLATAAMYAPLPEPIKIIAFGVGGLMVVALAIWMFAWATKTPAGAGESYFVAVANQGFVFGTSGNLLSLDKQQSLPAEVNPLGGDGSARSKGSDDA